MPSSILLSTCVASVRQQRLALCQAKCRCRYANSSSDREQRRPRNQAAGQGGHHHEARARVLFTNRLLRYQSAQPSVAATIVAWSLVSFFPSWRVNQGNRNKQKRVKCEDSLARWMGCNREVWQMSIVPLRIRCKKNGTRRLLAIRSRQHRQPVGRGMVHGQRCNVL